jgi:hypothetical protein
MTAQQELPSVIPQGAVLAAAAWWASRLGNCHHDVVGLSAPDRQLTAAGMDLAISMNLEAVRGKYSAGQAAAYRQALEEVIGEHVRDCRPPTCGGKYVGHGRHVFNCDYDPDETLCRAAERAGIDLDSRDLPAKTFMILKADSVTVSEGYGAPLETIWQ